jgi:tetratricopeptide (TPR) repeat protein
MAEGAEDPEVEVREGLEPVSPAAVSIALGRVGRKPGSSAVDAEAEAFLRKQSRLIDLQTEHLHEQRDLIISRLRWGRFSDRLKALLQGLTVLVGLGVAVALAGLAWSAAQDHAVVIDAFSVPPDLAQQGSTGAALATQLHDKLLAMREQTPTAIAGTSVREKAISEARVEIPETGLSLSEVDRFLRDRLGHEQQVSAEVAHVASGPDKGALVMTVRAGETPGVRLVQADGDLDALLQKAAEHVYDAVQPVQFPIWLNRQGRVDEAVAAARALDGAGDASQKAYGFYLVENFTRGTVPLRQSRELLAQAVAINPKLAPAYNNLAGSDLQLGHEEVALQEFRRAAALGANGLGFKAEAAEGVAAVERGNAEGLLGDWSGWMAFACLQAKVDPCDARRAADAFASGSVTAAWDNQLVTRRWTLASALVAVHDLEGAERIAAAPPPDLAGEGPSIRLRYEENALQTAVLLRQAREDWSGLAKLGPAIEQLQEAFPLAQRVRGKAAEALALAKLGDAPAARSIAGTLAPDCYTCLVYRGRIAETLGDRAEADRWFAEALRQGPSLPQAEEAWGRVRLPRGDADGALKLAREAHRKGPRFADALELSGEALLAKRDYAGAVDQFAAAAKITPFWGRLHVVWGEALMLSGRYHEARAQYETADGLGLTPSERAALNVLLARTAQGPLHG